jgi:hypothetical protein
MQKNKKGMNVVYFKYADGRQIRYQLCASDDPRLAPMGATVFCDQGEKEEKLRTTNRKNFFLCLSEEEVRLFTEWDEHNIRIGIANKNEWFKGASDEIIRSRHVSCMMASKHGPLLRTKINTDSVEVQEYDQETNALKAIPARDIEEKAVRSVPLCDPGSFWFQNQTWGMTTVCPTLMVLPIATDDCKFAWHNDDAPRLMTEARVVPFEPSFEPSYRTADGTLVIPEESSKKRDAKGDAKTTSVLLCD